MPEFGALQKSVKVVKYEDVTKLREFSDKFSVAIVNVRAGIVNEEGGDD